MKKIFYCLSLLLASNLVHAQSITTLSGSDKFIEVKVSDTLMATPDIIQFMIKLGSEDEYAYEVEYYEDDEVKNVRRENEDKSSSNKNKENLKLNQIELILTKLGLTYKYNKPSNDDPIGMSKDLDMWGNSFEVTLNSIEQLEKLQEELKKVDDIESIITKTSVSNKHELELKLIEKVMKKATEEAAAIAKSMGVTLDKPINVSNQSWDQLYSGMFSGENNSLGGLGGMFSLLGNMFKTGSQKTEVIISKSLVVRFSFK